MTRANLPGPISEVTDQVRRPLISPRYLTTAEVAEICRTSPESVRFWRHVRKGPKSFKVGRKVLYAVEDVEAWIAAARAEGPAA